MSGGLDLNLLTVFDAVMAEGSVKLAAKRLQMNSPAVSQSLGRLREAVGADLFVRSGNGLKPTPLAVSIWQGVHPALQQIKSSVTDASTFDPTTASRTITLDLPSGADVLVMPLLADEAAHAPGLEFRVGSGRAFEVLKDLRFGESWLALDYRPILEPGFRCEVLTQQEIVVITPRGDPRFAKGISEEQYAIIPQVAVGASRSTTMLPLTEMLDSAARSRHVRFIVPSLLSAVRIVTQHHHIASLPISTAKFCQTIGEVDIHRLPFSLPPMQFYIIWHERFDADPAHQWLRGTFARLAKRLGN